MVNGLPFCIRSTALIESRLIQDYGLVSFPHRNKKFSDARILSKAIGFAFISFAK